MLERPYRECLCREIDIGYRLDILVEDTVIVEVNAIETILPVHEAQLLSYLRLSGKCVGLLINFNIAHLRQGIRRRVCRYFRLGCRGSPSIYLTVPSVLLRDLSGSALVTAIRGHDTNPTYAQSLPAIPREGRTRSPYERA